MKRITLFLAGLLLLTSCADTVATPEVSYRTRFTIKNSSQSDLAFHWNGMEEEHNRFEYILFRSQSKDIVHFITKDGYDSLSDLREKIGDVTLFYPIDSKEGVNINDLIYDESQWTVTESEGWQFWELYIFPDDILPYK